MSLYGHTFSQWKNREIEKKLEAGTAQIGRMRRFWLTRNQPAPREYYDENAKASYSKEETAPAGKPIHEPSKTLPEVLAYAGRFRTDEGMTGYLKRVLPTLPETDRRTVENLLKLSDQEIRAEIKRISA